MTLAPARGKLLTRCNTSWFGFASQRDAGPSGNVLRIYGWLNAHPYEIFLMTEKPDGTVYEAGSIVQVNGNSSMEAAL